MNKNIIQKIGNIMGTVITVFVMLFALIIAYIAIFGTKDEDGTAIIFNKQARLVTSNSMDKSEFTDVSKYDIKSIPVNSIVFIEMVPTDKDEAYEWYDDLREGDVLTFKYVYSSQVVITHRLIKKDKLDDGSFILYFEGDNKDSDTNLLTQIIDTSTPETGNYVIGKVVGKSLIIGYLFTLIKNPVILIFVLILLIIMIICIKVISKTLKQKDVDLSKENDVDTEIKQLKEKVDKLLSEQSSED